MNSDNAAFLAVMKSSAFSQFLNICNLKKHTTKSLESRRASYIKVEGTHNSTQHDNKTAFSGALQSGVKFVDERGKLEGVGKT